jgi:hypothetical protein
LSAILTLTGLVLLLPSSPLVSLVTSGSTSSSGSGSQAGFGVSAGSTADTTATIESLLGLGLIGVGLILEVLSLFTQVGTAALPAESAEAR